MTTIVVVEDIRSVRLAAVVSAVQALRDAVRHEEQAEARLVTAREVTARIRLELGRELLEARKLWPERGPKAKGWGEFLGEARIDQDVALDAMEYARVVAERYPGANENVPVNLPTLADAGIDKRPRLSAAPAPQGATQGAPLAPTATPGNRDAWCTPEWLTELLPDVDLDPCSNPHSTVRAKARYSLEDGQNGLELPWSGVVYVNGPYSNLLPWAEKLQASQVGGAGFLVNADHSPEWWHLLRQRLKLRLDFHERLEFKPPPGITPSKNDRPQTLLMDGAFWAACQQNRLLEHGVLWQQIDANTAA